MNASPRRLSIIGRDGAASRRLAVRFGQGLYLLAANEALLRVGIALDGDAELPAPTLNDILDGIRLVDQAQEDVEWQELRMLTHARVRFGASWTQISEARGFASRQGAQERFKTLTARYPYQAEQYEQEAREAAERDAKEH